ncbi:MAG: hypothetical protein HOO99_03905 [Hyphomicrobiaceae bacterium]|nr:hypothetical protein [Hyphomicrobiaceae bacterium]
MSRTMGEVEARLNHGAEVHRETKELFRLHQGDIRSLIGKTDALHARTAALEKAAKVKPVERTSVKDWTEFLKAFWPYLFAVSMVAAKVFLGSVEPVMRWAEHLTTK